MLPEGSKAMGAHAPGPEDAQEQENGADGLANLTHSPQAIPAADAPARVRFPGVHAGTFSSAPMTGSGGSTPWKPG